MVGFKLLGGALAALFVSTSSVLRPRILDLLSSSSCTGVRESASSSNSSSGISPIDAITSTSFVITFRPTTAAARAAAGAAAGAAGRYNNCFTSPVAVGYLFALFFSLARSFGLLHLQQHQHRDRRSLPFSFSLPPLSFPSFFNNNNKQNTSTTTSTSPKTTTTTTSMSTNKKKRGPSTSNTRRPQEVTSTEVFSQLVNDDARPLSSIFVRGDTSNIPHNHPVITALVARWKNDSLPGKRAEGDVDKIALSIEGGGMRGCVAAGAAAAIHFLGLNNAVDVVYGSSAGSMIATYFISRQFR